MTGPVRYQLFATARRVCDLILSGKRPLSTADYVALAEAFKYSERDRETALRTLTLERSRLGGEPEALPIVRLVRPFVAEVTESARTTIHHRPQGAFL